LQPFGSRRPLTGCLWGCILGRSRKERTDLGFTIHYKGIEIVCDTPDDVSALAERLISGSSRAIELPFTRQGGTMHSSGSPQSPTIKGLINKLGHRQKGALRALISHGGRMHGQDLVKVTDADTLSALAAVLGPVYKLSRSRGPLEGFFSKEEITSDSGAQIRDYVIGERFLEPIREALSG
jgi:hypothetical protein